MPNLASFPEALLARIRSLYRGLSHRGDIESEMREEFRHHIELRTAALVREGLAPDEAARRACLEFGNVTHHQEAARASRGLAIIDRLGVSWLDLKLGIRMFGKYPGLSVTAVAGMAVAIAIAAGAFGFVSSLTDTTLPLDDGDRIVAIQNVNLRHPDRQAFADFARWRRDLRSVRDLSAFLSDSRNLIVPDRTTELVQVAEMSASGFRVARVPPLLGRTLLDDDERPGAPAVLVLGHDEWQRRFDGDSGVIGGQVRLGNVERTIVGVMPDEFRFPINHQFWVPLQPNPDGYEPGGGPSIHIFGRLVDGVTRDGAQAELTAIAARSAGDAPDTHENLRPRVLPYTYPFSNIDSPTEVWLLHGFQLALSLLLIVVSINVSILVYARTATRTGEIAVRTALGASRGRVVGQLFAEALVMSGTAAAIGLGIAAVGLELTERFQARVWGHSFPFWLRLRVSTPVVLYVAALAILAAVITGVLPAIKATGDRIQASLQRLSSHGSRMELGPTWTLLIVLQVAVAVAVLPFASYVAGTSMSRGLTTAGYPADEILRGTLSMERDEAPADAQVVASEADFASRFRARAEELERRLNAEPNVAGVLFSQAYPGNGSQARLEIEGSTTLGNAASVTTNRVGINFASVMGVGVIAGREFNAGDAYGEASPVIVNREFAERLLGGTAVLGRMVRINREPDLQTGAASAPGPWLQIVGVMPDFTVPTDFDPGQPARLYQPMTLTEAPTVLSVAIRVRRQPVAALLRRIPAIAAEIDPRLQVHGLAIAGENERDVQQGLLAIALVIAGVTASVLLLSAAGIYAMMSFTVARRRREIGIRTALGADRRRILTSIFAHAGAQLGAGVTGGLLLALLVASVAGIEGLPVLLVPGTGAAMIAIGLLAAVGPARRSLAVQPTEALRED